MKEDEMSESTRSVLERFSRPSPGRRGFGAGVAAPPPPELLGREGFEDVAAAAAELAQLHDEMNKANGEARRLEDVERFEAQRRDREALAASIRSGKGKDPGPVEIEKVEAQIKAARRRSEACQVAIASAVGDLTAQSSKGKGAWTARAGEHLSEARLAYLDAVEQLDRARRRLAEEESFSEWIAQLPEPGLGFRARLGTVAALSGEAWPRVVAALLTVAEGPAFDAAV
jgi:hypothetical protein